MEKILAALETHGLLIDKRGIALLAEFNGSVQTDHRLLSQGDIFVCIKGERFDGHNLVPDAIANGAVAIVCQTPLNIEFAHILVTDTRKAAAIIARLTMLPEVPPYKLIGVTGTNGKTTTSLILFEALRAMGYNCGWIGTLGYKINEVSKPTNHTTPDIIQLNSLFRQMMLSGVEFIVMEVSSHALALDRVYGVDFDYCLFSNLSRDHLDFHGTMDSYGEAKYMLFERNYRHGAVSIINTADTFGLEIYNRLLSNKAICYSIGGEGADFGYENIGIDVNKSSFDLVSSNGRLSIVSDLIGGFNICNLGLTAVTLIAMGFSGTAVEAALATVPPVIGRIQKVPNTHGIGVFVDYAHTPDAMENLLKSVEELPHRRIICVFGAGGNRDKGKRPLMLKSALMHSDAVIITDDNPRYESPDSIIKDIVMSSEIYLPWWIIRDRKTAINSAIRLAQPGDLVLICGKGHETYQEIEGNRLHFDDYEEAKAALDMWTPNIYKEDNELILPIDATMLDILYQENTDENEVRYSQPKHYWYLSTDSRTVKASSVFYAIKGEKFDGHDYLDAVISDSTCLAIHQRQDLSRHSSLIPVSDTVQAMGDICRKYLLMFAPKRIALTGSTGKTTSKELIAMVLDNSKPCLKTLHNENNIIGLCKTILRILPTHEYAVFELGTNHHGEIGRMADVVCPDIGIILNIGPSHLEFLGDEDGVYEEKSALFKRPLALRLYPGDDSRFEGFRNDGIGIGFGDQCDYQITNHTLTQSHQTFHLADLDWTLPYAAPHFAMNAAFAIVIALKLGLDYTDINSSLAVPIRLDMRMQVETRYEGFLIIDCYNANPCSMQKAIEYWHQLDPEKPHVAILGDMLELGESASMYHQMIGAMLAELQPIELYTVGTLSKRYHLMTDTNPHNFTTAEALLASGSVDLLPRDSVILLKASHGMHLELLIPTLRGES